MKILWAKANKLLPVTSGGDIRSYHLARHVALRHQLTFLSYYDGRVDVDYEEALAAHFPGAVAICTGKKELRGLRRALDYLSRVREEAPYAVSRFLAMPVRQELQRWFASSHFDLAVSDFLDAAFNFPEELSTPSILFQHNVESEIWRRYAMESKPPKKWMYQFEFKRMLRYERETVRKFHHIISVSEHDRRLMAAWTDPSRITVVPTGVDLQKFRPELPREGAGPLVMFVGAMDWEPNIDAVEYFCREIWPSVQSEVPGARFRIVGRNPDQRVRELTRDSVEVTGSVASVVDHLREAAVVVVPLRIAGGTRLKIYEAMAAGKAVVSTSVGAEGLDVHHGQDIFLADTAPQFGSCIVSLLTHSELRRQCESAAAQSVRRYDWAMVGNQFNNVLEQVRASTAEHGVTAKVN